MAKHGGMMAYGIEDFRQVCNLLDIDCISFTH